MNIPESLSYSPEHLWTKATADGLWEAGITDYAQDLLGDIVFIDAPTVGSKLLAHQPCGLVESVKTGSDLHALVDGTVVEINQALLTSPELINDKPYQAWIFKYQLAVGQDPLTVANSLLDADAYKALIASL
ncbi:MAG: glycine cleavage system protein GcvH [Methylotenera sp.]|nr:glycine cleavage system protein GcvH [Methylotenera sp.]